MIGVKGEEREGDYLMRGDINKEIDGKVEIGQVMGEVEGERILKGIYGEKMRILLVIVMVLIDIEMGMRSLGLRLKI